jgi:hypothetical protein
MTNGISKNKAADVRDRRPYFYGVLFVVALKTNAT